MSVPRCRSNTHLNQNLLPIPSAEILKLYQPELGEEDLYMGLSDEKDNKPDGSPPMKRRENFKASFHLLLNNMDNYVQLMRPITIIQAVGAFTVGKLVMLMQHNFGTISSNAAIIFASFVLASMSIYLSYGAGMAMNDIVDGNTIDAQHPIKKERPVPSGKISIKQGWIFVTALSFSSSLLAAFATSSFQNKSYQFPIWTLSNLFLMFSYAKLGLQKLFLIKNIIVGYLSVSPLIGAAILHSSLGLVGGVAKGSALSAVSSTRLLYLAIVGLCLGIAREIVKDIEDVDVDDIAGKLTLPMVLGTKVSHAIAYSLVAAVFCITCSTPFLELFSKGSSWGHLLRILPGCFLSVRAALCKNLSRGQKLLKQAIYAYLGGSIIGLVRILIAV